MHRRQLDALGIRRSAIARRVAIGSLHPLFGAIFAVGHPVLEPMALEVAALLHAGENCVLSHLSAAILWQLLPGPGDLVEVTIAGRHVRDAQQLRVHRTREFDGRDVALQRGFPVTAPARTVLDLAASSSDETVAAAIAQARVMGLVGDHDLRGAIERSPTRAGAARLRRVLRAEHEPALTRSEPERRVLALIAGARLPAPAVNARLHGYEVDLLWRRERLVVEIDGHAFHGHRAAFERDRRRDQVLAAAGFRVIRITWLQLEREPLAVIARIAQALATAVVT
ncbi:MAG TPA: DUF559 domain-containing protein [Solirubrobacteraceae bacterium]